MNYFTDYIHNAALSLLFTVLTCDDVENKCNKRDCEGSGARF